MLFECEDIEVIAGFLAGLRPDPRISVREWADTFRRLPETSARPGKFDSNVTPYLREVMDKLSAHDPAQKIVVKKSSQVGFTECGNNWLGYVIDAAPAAFLYVMPTDLMMKDTSKNRIGKMIESTPSLREKIKPEKARDKGNTLLFKEFAGGFVKMVGANSPVGLSSTPVRFVYMDEIDRYPLSVGGEGSALALAETRTITFGARKKLFLTSTPTLKGISAIDAAFEATGQRFYHVPCPFCGHFQPLVIEQLRYAVGDYSSVTYECVECKKEIDPRYKGRMLTAGKWVAKFPEREDGITFGYFINALYSPVGMYTWADLVKERDACGDDVPKLIAFTNTKLGEPYEATAGDKPDWEALYDRAEDYAPNKPFSSVVFITAGVDVQADRLEIEVVGWMEGKGSQSLDYRVIEGDTSQPGGEVWQKLAALFTETWTREDGHALPLRLMGLDTGYNTAEAYAFTQKHGTTKVIPLKGRDKQETYVSSPRAVNIVKSGKKLGNVKVWNVGVSLIKSEVYGFLKLKINKETGEVPAAYCHFPNRAPSYFRGLTAEELIISKDKRGFNVFTWVKKYARNEPLDTRVYARAAAYVVGMDRWTPERWKQEYYPEAPKTEPAASSANEPNKPEQSAQPKQTPTKRKSNFWNT